MESLAGSFLVASLDLRDPNFARTVVLLIRHTEEEAFGLIINRQTSVSVGEVWSKVSDTPCHTKQHICLGGPVQGPLMAVHSRAELGEMEIGLGAYFCTDGSLLEKLVAEDSLDCRYFLGYAGWGPGQLENEMSDGSWHVSSASSELIFAADDELWETLLKHCLGQELIVTLGIKHVPHDPRLN